MIVRVEESRAAPKMALLSPSPPLGERVGACALTYQPGANDTSYGGGLRDATAGRVVQDATEFAPARRSK